jgi:hypothetical protein
MSAHRSKADIAIVRAKSENDPGCVKTPTSNLSVESFVSITLNKKRTALAVTIERRKERKQFCAFSARARFHTAWTHFGHWAWSNIGPFFLLDRHSISQAEVRLER